MSAELQGLCCPLPRLLLSQPCLGHCLATKAVTKADTEAQTGFAFCFSTASSKEQGTNSSPKAFAPKGPGIIELFQLEKIFQISKSNSEETVASLTSLPGSPELRSCWMQSTPFPQGSDPPHHAGSVRCQQGG